MADTDDIALPQAEAKACRELAARARRLAWQITDDPAREDLEKHAKELEKQGHELEARVAVMKQSAEGTRPQPDQDIAALKQTLPEGHSGDPKA
jgi:acyl transferase domain-containing protein